MYRREQLTRSCRRTGRSSSPHASSLRLSARRSISILSRTSTIPENSDSLPNGSGSCSSGTAIKSVTPASKMKWPAGNVPTALEMCISSRSPAKVSVLNSEFDWGEVLLRIRGIWSKFYLAVFVLPFSLYRFARLYPRSTRLEVIQAHIEFFHEIGAVPETIFYDRMSVVYDSQKQKLNEKFLEFSMHSGFRPCVCNPASPHEKGTDEESVGYIRRVAFGERSSFESFEEAIEWLSTCLAEINARPVYRRPDVPVQGLVQEQDLMHPLPTLEYANYDLKRTTISRYSLVKCEGNFYSVPDTYRPRQITLKVLVDRIALLDGNDVIASHRRLTGKQQYSLDITHYVKTFHRKPGALPNARVLAQVDELIQDLFNRYYLDDPKGFLPILDLMRETSPEALSSALTILNEQNIPPTYDTLRFFRFKRLSRSPSVEDLRSRNRILPLLIR